MSVGRLENLLGALALSVTDDLLGPGESLSGPVSGGSDRAALVTLFAHPDRTVSWLADVLAVSGSGATRVVDRLERAGLVTRTAGGDSRQRLVRLTPAGARRAREIMDGRLDALARRTATLTSEHRRLLEDVLDVLVAESASARLPALRMCRLCDRAACAPGENRVCPLERTVDAADPHA